MLTTPQGLFGVVSAWPVARLRLYTDKIDADGDGGCWIWTAAVGAGGYGAFKSAPNRTDQAHRIAYCLYLGDPAGKLVMHNCDTPRCCNPSHLSLGTNQDNRDDRTRKGR